MIYILLLNVVAGVLYQHLFFFSLKYIELAKCMIYVLLLNVVAGVLYQHLFFFSLKYIELAKCMIYVLLLNVVAGVLYQHLAAAGRVPPARRGPHNEERCPQRGHH